MNWWNKLWCNHSWFIHWLHTPSSAMEVKICSKCGKSEAIKITNVNFDNSKYLENENE